MSDEKKPLLTDAFLDELAKEISRTFGGPEYENEDSPELLTNKESV